MEDNEHESGLMKDNVLFFSKDNIDNYSASPTLLSGREYLYQQYQQWGTNNKYNSLASANVGRAQMLFTLSLYKIYPVCLLTLGSIAEHEWHT